MSRAQANIVLSLRSVLDFYAPYTSPMMPERFQRMEAAFPLAITVTAAVTSMIPLFHSGHWVIGILSVIIMCILLYSIYCGVMYSSSEPTEEGGRYISPSVQGWAEMESGFFGFIVVMAGFFLTTYLTGWPPLN